MHAEWDWLAAGGAAELDWWLYAASWSPSPSLCLHNSHLDRHQWKMHKKKKSDTSTHTHTEANGTPKYGRHTQVGIYKISVCTINTEYYS